MRALASLRATIPPLGPMYRWKERTDFMKSSSDFYTYKLYPEYSYLHHTDTSTIIRHFKNLKHV